MLMQWNFYMEQGLLAFDRAGGTVGIRYEKYHAVVARLLAQILALQSRGDKRAADEFIARYTGWDEDLHGVIARKLREAARYRYTLFGFGALGRD
jgi:hypothetical protein